MKKPNITEGEWEIVKYSDGSFAVGSTEWGQICDMNELKDEHKANAQAISTIPDMFDRLIEQLDLVNYLLESRDILIDSFVDRLERNKRDLEETLTKAGVQIEETV